MSQGTNGHGRDPIEQEKVLRTINQFKGTIKGSISTINTAIR